jgi:uncharacterized membrane protein YphA (DoxX/SURF4 family)
MDILLYLACLLVGFGASLLLRPGDQPVNTLSKLYLGLVLLSGISRWIYSFSGITDATALGIISQEMDYAVLVSHLILGFLLGRIAIAFKYLPADIGPWWSTLKTTIWALSIAYANLYILFTYGKSRNMPEMLSFFHQSGYAPWLLYFNMSAEIAGAIGVLTHFKWRMGVPATIGLSLMMLGAIFTHWHDGDSFPASYDAVSQLISGSLLLVLYSLVRRLKRLVFKAALIH